MSKETYSDKLLDPRWQKKSGIYKITINGQFYIGSAVDLPKRLRAHLNDLKGNKHANIHLQRAFDKYQDIDFDVLELAMDVSLLIPLEQKYIDTLKPHYNISLFAGSQLGLRHSEISKLRLSIMQKGRVIPAETRALMSQSQTGKKLSTEHIKNISLAKRGEKNPYYKAGENHPQFGIPKSETTRNRISETSILNGSHKGQNNAAAKSGVLYDVVTGANYIFQCLKPLCEKLGVGYAYMSACAKQERFYKGRLMVTYTHVPNNIQTRLDLLKTINF